MHRRPRGSLATALLLAPFAFLGGMFADRAVFAAHDGNTYRQLDIFTRVLSYVENNYVEDVSEKQLIQGAIKGMVGTLDPHTLYMSAETFKDMKIDTSGEFGGLGIEITSKTEVKNGVKSEFLTVVSPIDDTPAARAGIKSGDIILKIDAETTADMDLPTAISRMRGPAGSKVVLGIMRVGFTEPRDIVIVRDHIRIVSVDGKLLDGYGYVKVKNFQDHTDRFLKKTLDELRRENKGELKGLVLDLRNNPGGLLDQSVKVSDRFLPGNLTIVSTKGRGAKHVEEEKSHDRDTEPNYPIIVLVNGGSASASEIVAGALQDHGRALVMGTQTFGKGSVQTVIELEDGSGLKLTIARYYTPKGRSIQERGITPDIIVKDAALEKDDTNGPREVDLRNHFRNEFKEKEPPLQGDLGKAPAKDAGVPAPVDPRVTAEPQEMVPGTENDAVLRTALDYLRSAQILKAQPAPKAALVK